MRRKMMLSVSIVLIFVFTLLAPPLIGSVFAEEEDGLYSIEYEVLKADSDSTSIGNDYFEKPATLIVEGGEKHIQLTVNHSDYVKSRSEEHTSELQSRGHLVCRLLLEKKK